LGDLTPLRLSRNVVILARLYEAKEKRTQAARWR